MLLKDMTIISIGPFPDMAITDMNMGFHYTTDQDSIFLEYANEDSTQFPIEVYAELGLLTGDLSINKRGVFASGELEIYDSKISSNFFDFKQENFLSRYSNFVLYPDNKLKPAIFGEELTIDFDLSKNEVYLQPEYEGFASFSFPYSEIKTSITEGLWDLQNQLFVMEKKPNIDLFNSYFYSTKKRIRQSLFLWRKSGL